MDFVEPVRVAPRLATYVVDVEVPGAPSRRRVVSSGALLRSAAVQSRSCGALVGRLGGVQDESLDVFVDVFHNGNRLLPAAGGAAMPVARPGLLALTEAVARGLYDGVVVDSLPVLVGNVVEGLWLSNALCSGSCELHVATRRDVGLWDTKAAVFRAALEEVRPVAPRWLGSRGFERLSFFSDPAPCPSGAPSLSDRVMSTVRSGESGARRAVVLQRLQRVESEMIAGVSDGRELARLQHRRRRLELQLCALMLSAVRVEAVRTASGMRL